jgi:hypothetical protein
MLTYRRESDPAVYTTHYLRAPWGLVNNPRLLHSYGILNTSVPVAFSHATALSADDTVLLYSTDQCISNHLNQKYTSATVANILIWSKTKAF